MSNKKDLNKKEFIHLILHTADQASQDQNSAKEYLQSEGVNLNKFLEEGLKKIKRTQMLKNAKETEEKMLASESVKNEAIIWVEKLLADADFSLPELVKREELTMSFRNVTNLSQEDIRNILIRHFTLKLMNQQKNNNNEL